MMPGNYTPQGRAHIILHRLAQANARVGHLYNAMGWGPDNAPVEVRAAFWGLIDHLQEVGLVKFSAAVLVITPAGRAVLLELEALDPLRPVTAPVYPSRKSRALSGMS